MPSNEIPSIYLTLNHIDYVVVYLMVKPPNTATLPFTLARLTGYIKHNTRDYNGVFASDTLVCENGDFILFPEHAKIIRSVLGDFNEVITLEVLI